MTPSGATLRNILKDPLPDKLFVDTNFFMAMLFSKNPAKDSACKQFLKRLRNHMDTNARFVIVFNTIVYYEMYIALTKYQLLKNGINKKAMISTPQILRPFKSKVTRQFELFLELLSGLRRLEISVKDNTLFDTVLETQMNYSLQYADAFHLGTMLFAKENNFASFDVVDFKKIPGINLWCVY